MYNNLYNPQVSVDRINSQMTELERQKAQLQQLPMQQPTNLTQNFQIAPNNNNVMRYANSIEEVQKDFVIGDTPYFSKDLSEKYKRIYNIPRKVGQVAGAYPDNILLITMNGHITCSRYGVIYDSFDCRNREAEEAWIVE